MFKRRVVENGKNKGETVWYPIAYEPNVKEALRTLVTREINGTGLKNFKVVVDKVDELMKQIDKFKVDYIPKNEVSQ